MTRFGIVCTIVLLANFASAGTFTGNGGQGLSKVGPLITDDYPSLDAAAKDFSSRIGGSTGDWTLEITTTSLVEPNNIAFGNETNGFKVTVKPAAGLNVDVKFTTTTTNITGGFTGNWLIGLSGITNQADIMTTTSNFTIDGSNNGSASRNLTISNVAFTNNISLIRVVGGCQNTTIKNCVLVSSTTGASQTFDVEFTCRRTTAGFSNIPSGCHISNCDMSIVSAPGANAQNILFRQASVGNVPPGSAMDNATITSNTIKGYRQPINLGFVSNATVSDNILSTTIPLGDTALVATGLSHGANATSGWTVNILRNRFVNWQTDATAQRGLGPQLDLSGGIVAPQTGTYNVFNDFSTGYNYNNATAVTGTLGSYKAVQVSGTSCTAAVKIYHNSFNMPNIPLMANATKADVYNAVAITATGFAGSVDVKDNIFRYEQNNGVVFYRNNSILQTGTFTSNFNTFYLANGATMASYQNTTLTPNYADLSAWQGAGFDLNSNISNPTVPAAPGLGKWASSTDLHFDSDPGSVYLGTGTGVLTDIDNEARNGSAPVKGADELLITTIVTGARDWELFE
ncbi:MAG: hypothetical protein ACR2IE_04395 [Candidatus Sumerlaeaceae bacterium]